MHSRVVGTFTALLVLLAPLGAAPAAAAPSAPEDLRQATARIEQEMAALAAANPGLFAPPAMPWAAYRDAAPFVAFEEACRALADLRVRAALQVPDNSTQSRLAPEDVVAWARGFKRHVEENASALVAAANRVPAPAPGPDLEDRIFRQMPAFSAMAQSDSMAQAVALLASPNGTHNLGLVLPILVSVESERVAWQSLNTTVAPPAAGAPVLTRALRDQIRAGVTYIFTSSVSPFARPSDRQALENYNKPYVSLVYTVYSERAYVQGTLLSSPSSFDVAALAAAERARAGNVTSLLSREAAEWGEHVLGNGSSPGHSDWVDALGHYAVLRLLRGLPALKPTDFPLPGASDNATSTSSSTSSSPSAPPSAGAPVPAIPFVAAGILLASWAARRGGGRSLDGQA